MACPTVTTGNEFLVGTLSHLDCQAQTLGSFGFQSLAGPGSPAAILLSALLTLFIALYGFRLLFGPSDEPRDLINGALKIGIVLTISLSWPAWRITAYDTVLHGPAEIAASIMPSTMASPSASFPQRLQTVDNAIAAFTVMGTGRQNGRILDRTSPGGFRAVALEDEAGFGWARPIYLASTIGSIAALRIAGGLLLALAPLLAGALLFDLTRGLFVGWLRGLALVVLGTLGLTVLLSIQVAVMEPWLADVLARRNLGYATPTAPTELLALVSAFAIATAGLMAIFAKVAFQTVSSVSRPVLAQLANVNAASPQALHAFTTAGSTQTLSRAAALSESVTTTMRREELQAEAIGPSGQRRIAPISGTPSSAGYQTNSATPLGSGFRRTTRRQTQSHQKRDQGA